MALRASGSGVHATDRRSDGHDNGWVTNPTRTRTSPQLQTQIGIPRSVAGGQGGSEDGPAPATAATPDTAAHDQTQRDVRIYSQYFRRYELLIEFKNLRNPEHCPNGMYVMPEPNNLNEWWGVLMLHRGYYREAVFKFHLSIPDDYPSEGPTLRFITEMFHPLVDRSGFFNMRQQFPVWRPNKDYICHLLHYAKNSFKEAVLANLEGKFLYERPVFARLASQCAQLSASDGSLYDDSDESIIKFRNLDDAEFEKVKSQMLASVVRFFNSGTSPFLPSPVN
ncbi:ubiquitin-conjugating enzyme/RWD-like protein [Chytriomyces sp. MP71]|nr:ubiquitin-conjugating enzyme/RWD-like protein [Chytriomyces sp. MP71]